MKRFLKRVSIPIFCILTLLGTAAQAKEPKPKTEAVTPPSAGLYKGLDTFSRVLDLVREDFVENVKDQDLVNGAIRGMLATLDPHSTFMPPDVYRELKVDTEGRFGGVGLEVTEKDHILTVVTPIEGSPAHKAGIREGDRILRIEGQSTKDLGLADAVRKMRGARGSKVSMTLIHRGDKEPYDVTLRRDIIRLKSVRSEMLEPGRGYVRVTSFQEGTTQELQKAIQDLEKASDGRLKGLIIDLRNNPGGLLDEAVDMADLFLDSGIIVTTASRKKEIDKKTARKDGTEPAYPMVVLINGGSASAAEIVAGALQDQKRATLLGTQSFGKGSVQTIFELGEGSALKLTVAKYYTPNGRSIQAEGITPDIVVQPKKGAGRGALDQAIREKDLKGHLASDNEKKGKKSKESDTEKPDKNDKKEENQPEAAVKNEDVQKQAALEYLRKKEK